MQPNKYNQDIGVTSDPPKVGVTSHVVVTPESALVKVEIEEGDVTVQPKEK